MRDRRGTQELLPEKLLAIREFLSFGEVEMAESLASDITSQSGRPGNIKPGRILEYENGRLEPNLLVLVAYARLARIHLELLADDRFTIQEFREHLGKQTL
jgi:hypothetical protein